jgi:hypothetical protein
MHTFVSLWSTRERPRPMMVRVLHRRWPQRSRRVAVAHVQICPTLLYVYSYASKRARKGIKRDQTRCSGEFLTLHAV